NHREDLGAAIHAVDDLGFDREDAPDIFAHLRRFVVEHFRKNGFARVDVAETDLAALLIHNCLTNFRTVFITRSSTDSVNGIGSALHSTERVPSYPPPRSTRGVGT